MGAAGLPGWAHTQTPSYIRVTVYTATPFTSTVYPPQCVFQPSVEKPTGPPAESHPWLLGLAPHAARPLLGAGKPPSQGWLRGLSGFAVRPTGVTWSSIPPNFLEYLFCRNPAENGFRARYCLGNAAVRHA